MIVGFFTSRILLNQLGIIDFGVYNVVGSIIVIFTFLNSTLLIGTQRFINFELSNQYMLFLQNCDGLNVSDKSFKVLKFDNYRITLAEEL